MRGRAADRVGAAHLATLEDVQLEDGIYEHWRGPDVVEKIPADRVEKVERLAP